MKKYFHKDSFCANYIAESASGHDVSMWTSSKLHFRIRTLCPMWRKTSMEQGQKQRNRKIIPVIPKRNNNSMDYDANHKGKKTTIL